MIGQTISHYRILEKLGEGGMGIVYKAHDTKLDRDVALKFLPHHITATADEQARFLQEARAASALNHPNICGIHSIGEDGEKQFIEMEYVDGKTLRQMVPIQKTQTAIDYAIQIGEALQEAHSKGVVHRDVKTDNIMVNSKNQIKVMDFGLAKLKGSLKLTKTSSTVGTLAYMAPEQIQGGEVDARSDIFSFGVVLYEMLTGHVPFRGEHEAAMVYSIVNEEPTPINRYLPEVSSELVHVLNRALEKDPEDRYQGVHDMVIDLRRLKKQTSRVSRVVPAGQPSERVAESAGKRSNGAWPTRIPLKIRWLLGGLAVVVLAALAYVVFRPSGEPAGGSAKAKSLAVVYFENRTHVKELDKNLVSMLINNLARNNELSVVSEQRLFDLLKNLGKQDDADIGRTNATEVAKRAAAKNMVVGQILSVGSQWSFQANLLDVETGNVVNSAHVETAPKEEELFSVADKLTAQVSEWLKATPSEPLRISEGATSSYDAYRYYEKGMQYSYRFEYDDAINNFEGAIKLDSTFALAHLRLALLRGIFQAFTPIPGRGLSLARESIARAKRYAMNLSERDKKFVQVIDVMVQRDIKAYARLLRESATEFPDDKEVVLWSAMMFWMQGDFEGSLSAFERAIELDHSYPDAYNMLAYVCAATGQYERAFSAIKTYTALIPDDWNGYDSGCDVYMMAGRFEEALKQADEGLKRVPSFYNFYVRRAQTYFLMGRPDKARDAIKPLAQFGETWLESMNRYIAVSFLVEGRLNEAVDVLQKEIQRLRKKNNQISERTARWYLARMFIEQNKFDESLRDLEELRTLSESTFTGPFNPWPIVCDYYSGLCLARKGDFDQAEARALAIKTAAETKIHDLSYLNYYKGLMAEIELSRARVREASAAMKEVLPFNRIFFPRFRILEARISVRQGDKATALRIYDRTYNLIWIASSAFGGEILDFCLERSKLDYYKGEMYERCGDKTEAIKFYEKAISNWRNADKDYVNLVDAKARLANLVAKK
jgi:tetratricopeptide (TPR) repeat protein/predicted Ser/Thr protein kinase